MKADKTPFLDSGDTGPSTSFLNVHSNSAVVTVR